MFGVNGPKVSSTTPRDVAPVDDTDLARLLALLSSEPAPTTRGCAMTSRISRRHSNCRAVDIFALRLVGTWACVSIGYAALLVAICRAKMAGLPPARACSFLAASTAGRTPSQAST